MHAREKFHSLLEFIAVGRLAHQSEDRAVDLNAEHLVGRSSACHLHLPEPVVSGRHAVLRWSGEGWEVRDLGSRNGTFVDGTRVPASAVVRIEEGSRLAFGSETASWVLTDASAPEVMARRGDVRVVLDGDILSVPNADEPKVTIVARAGRWWLEDDVTVRELANGDVFVVDGEDWEFVCPQVATRTATASSIALALERSTVLFRVSTNEEHVEVIVKSPEGPLPVGVHAFNYLLLTLARQRVRDRDEGLPEHGWIDADALLRMLPEYRNRQHVNLHIHRARKCFAKVGLADAGKLVERRRGEVRFGIAQVEIDVVRDL